jgi:hypothetical protein
VPQGTGGGNGLGCAGREVRAGGAQLGRDGSQEGIAMKTRTTIHWLAGLADVLLLAVPALVWAGGPIDPPPVNPPSRGEDSRCQFLLEETENLLEQCEASNVTFPGDGWPQDAYPSGGIPLSYTDNLDGTFTDDNTGLMWEAKLAEHDPLCDFDEQVDRNVRCVQNRYSWAKDLYPPFALDGTAQTGFLDVLNGVQFAGHDDWRLPTAKELQSLVDYSRLDPEEPDVPAVSPELPGATASDYYWSSTAYADFRGIAWYVGFDNGNVNYGGGKARTYDLHVRAVRGGW